MTLLRRHAFIVKASGFRPQSHRATLATPGFVTWVVGVRSLDQAVIEACALVAAGAQLIELCGGFTPEQAEWIYDEIGQQVPVGVVTFDGAAAEQLAHLLGEV